MTARAEFRAFADAELIPHADRHDREEHTPPSLIEKLARRKYLGALLPRSEGGMGLDMVTFGLLNEELGRGCSSARSLLTVHSMVAHALDRWGSKSQKTRWVGRLASGESLAAFALSEPDAGSDARAIKTEAAHRGDAYVLNGRKKWITFGQVADVFLVFAQVEARPAAFLVERNSPGLEVEPISGMLGVRASMLAELRLKECRVPAENLVGRVGFGISHVASAALDYGRYSVAWGCVGLAQHCLEATLRYTGEREQFGVHLREHQLVQRLITRMLVGVKAARLLCYEAGRLKDAKNPRSIVETAAAKYFASTTAMQVASDAVQLHGANGCSGDYPVQRHLRDAKVMEIIEGSTQMQELMIAQNGFQEWTI
nr:acyl-CoA dehydrogenase [uncultured bacterium]